MYNIRLLAFFASDTIACHNGYTSQCHHMHSPYEKGLKICTIAAKELLMAYKDD